MIAIKTYFAAVTILTTIVPEGRKYRVALKKFRVYGSDVETGCPIDSQTFADLQKKNGQN